MSTNNINPKVTVVIPTYNRENTIIQAVDSVLEQTYENFELLIVDDGSKDRTKEMVMSIKDQRIRYIKSPMNRGAGNARNIGIRAAKGDYIAFQDSDDYWFPEKLKKQVERMDNSCQEVGLVYTRFFYEQPEGRLEWPPKEIPYENKNGAIYPCMFHYNPVGGPTMMVKKECFQQVGLFRTDLRSMEDYELALRISKRYHLSLVDELLVKAAITPGSLSKDIMAHIQTSCILIKIYKDDMLRYHVLDKKINDLKTLGMKILTIEQVEQMINASLN